ncbi:hypothetical protein [Solibacillus sp. NPDC093137]|uniref:hypothetical protein n=1 Tax=Solibacillus sp. NPDC093137 TaxID=3390678 RepID=UPI003D001848
MNSQNRDTRDPKIIVSNNLKEFIEYTGRSYSWFIKKTEIPKTTFYKVLNGEGDIDKHIQKILDLFGIDDPFYFHKTDFKLPQREKKVDITKMAAANYVFEKGEEKEFQKTLNMLNDFINIIDILKKNNLDHVNKEIYK